LTTVEGLAKAITAVGNAFNGLSQFTAGVIDSFKPLADAFFDVGSGIGDIDEAAFRSAGELAGFVTQLNLLSGPAITVTAALIALNQALAIGGSVAAATAALGSVGGSGLLGALGSLAALGAAGAGGFGIGTLASEGLDELTNAFTETEESLGTWIYSLVSGADDVAMVADLMAPLPATIRDVGSAADSAVGSLWDLDSGIGKLDDEFGTIADLTPYIKDLAPAFDGASASVERLGQASQELDLKEKLALIDAQTQITTAKIEADAKKISDAFESINVGIESTGKLLGELFGELGDADNFRDKFAIEDQINLENERRTKELELQEKLTKATIDELKARQRAMESGGALITVNGDGLQPHLEAIMYSLFEAIQVRVNADGYELLLGAGP
jgi:hypothetical protein